jgi:hypothetical protein
VAKRSARPAGPLALTQADVDRLITGHRPTAKMLATRLNAERPSARSAKAVRRGGDKVGPVEVTAAELAVLVKGGRPPAFVRRLEATEKSRRGGGAAKGRAVTTKKEYPSKKPPQA